MLRTLLLSCFSALASTAFAQLPPGGLQLWLKADVGVVVKQDSVLEWKDQSGNHYDAVLSTPFSPKHVFDSRRGIKAIRFDGHETGLMTRPFRSFPNKRGTVVVVARVNGPSSTSGIGAGSLVSTYHGEGNTWQMAANADKYMFYDGVGKQGYFSPQSFAADWRVVSLVRPADTVIQFLFNGEDAIHHPVSPDLEPSLNTLKIGYNALVVNPEDSVTEVLNGDIAEVIVYDRALSAEQLQNVHAYLLDKYNFPLPSPPFYLTAWFLTLISLLIVSSGIAIAKIISQRKLKHQLQQLLMQKQLDDERQRISREMHDDIGAGLTQIILMSDVAKRNSSAREIDLIAETSRRLVGNMSEIIWSMNPENKTLEQLMSYVREQLDRLLEYSGFKYAISLPDNGKELVLSNEEMRTILLVMKEVVNNSVKHSRGEKIDVKVKLEGSTLGIVITDDGRGFLKDSVTAGNGLKNIRHRTQQLKGSAMDIISAPGQGFRFQWTVELSTTT